MHYKVMFL
jgi:mitogen-activated protein kinase 15